jgi:hypothetical protein
MLGGGGGGARWVCKHRDVRVCVCVGGGCGMHALGESMTRDADQLIAACPLLLSLLPAGPTLG